MPKLTDQEVLKFNQRVPGIQGKSGLGTILQSLLGRSNSVTEYADGVINTGNAVVDDCETVNMSTKDDATKFTNVADAVKFYKGAGSNKLEALTTTATGSKVYRTIVSADWSLSNRIGFYAFSNISLSAGDVKLYIKDTVAGDQLVNLPALTGGIPKFVEIDVSGLTLTAVVRYGFQCNKAAIFNLNVDQITRYATASCVSLAQTPVIGNAVKVSSLLKAATGTHTRVALTEDTGFMVAPDPKRIIMLSDQSLNSLDIGYTV